MRTWATCKPQKALPARTHWSTTIPSQKMAAHEGAFMSLFTRQSGGQRVYQAKTVKTHSNNLVMLAHIQLKPFYRLSTRDVTHVRNCTRPSPALPYCKRRETGRGPGNEASAKGFPGTSQVVHQTNQVVRTTLKRPSENTGPAKAGPLFSGS